MISPDTLQYLCEWSSSVTPSHQRKNGLHEPLTPIATQNTRQSTQSHLTNTVFISFYFGKKTSLSSVPSVYSWLSGHFTCRGFTHTWVPGVRGHPRGLPARLCLSQDSSLPKRSGTALMNKCNPLLGLVDSVRFIDLL